MNITPFTEHFRVRSYEAGETAAATIVSICDYLQEIASNHAYELALSVEQLSAAKLTWVLSRLHVRMTGAYPGWRERIRVETWPSGEDGLYATREFLIMNDAGDQIGAASSAWLLVDTDRRKPVRIPQFVSDLRIPQKETPLSGLPRKLDAPAHETSRVVYRLLRTDLDLNMHVNNARYVEWAWDAACLVNRRYEQPTELDILFRAETTYPEDLIVTTGNPGPDGALTLKLIKQSDEKVAAVVRFR